MVSPYHQSNSDDATVQSPVDFDSCLQDFPSCSYSVGEENEDHDNMLSCHEDSSDEHVSCLLSFPSSNEYDDDCDSVEDNVFNNKDNKFFEENDDVDQFSLCHIIYEENFHLVHTPLYEYIIEEPSYSVAKASHKDKLEGPFPSQPSESVVMHVDYCILYLDALLDKFCISSLQQDEVKDVPYFLEYEYDSGCDWKNMGCYKCGVTFQPKNVHICWQQDCHDIFRWLVSYVNENQVFEKGKFWYFLWWSRATK